MMALPCSVHLSQGSVSGWTMPHGPLAPVHGPVSSPSTPAPESSTVPYPREGRKRSRIDPVQTETREDPRSLRASDEYRRKASHIQAENPERKAVDARGADELDAREIERLVLPS